MTDASDAYPDLNAGFVRSNGGLRISACIATNAAENLRPTGALFIVAFLRVDGVQVTHNRDQRRKYADDGDNQQHGVSDDGIHGNFLDFLAACFACATCAA